MFPKARLFVHLSPKERRGCGAAEILLDHGQCDEKLRKERKERKGRKNPKMSASQFLLKDEKTTKKRQSRLQEVDLTAYA